MPAVLTVRRKNGSGASARDLFEIARDLVDASLRAGFVLVATRRAGDANRADGVVADRDRQRAACGNDVGEEQLSGDRILPTFSANLPDGVRKVRAV